MIGLDVVFKDIERSSIAYAWMCIILLNIGVRNPGLRIPLESSMTDFARHHTFPAQIQIFAHSHADRIGSEALVFAPGDAQAYSDCQAYLMMAA